MDRLSGIADGLAGLAETGAQHAPARAPSAYWRRCPYCIEYIDLLRCDVVSAVRHGAHAASQSAFDNLEPSGPRPDPDGWADGSEMVRRDGYEVFFDADQAQRGHTPRSLAGDLFGHAPASAGERLFPLANIDPRKIPRRLCERCRHVLPAELDERDTLILAVVGVTGAGKTHYLAQALTEGAKRGSLHRFGCTEFAPTDTDDTARMLHEKYYTRVVRRRELFEATNPAEAPRQFTFTVTVDNRRFLLVTHDIAGESLTDPYQRAQNLVFLRRADAMIFLLDPTEFDAVRPRLPAQLIEQDKPADQVHLLRQCLRELDQTSADEIPVRVVVAKSDLLTSYCQIRGPWLHPPARDWREDIGRISDEVQGMLGYLNETEVVRLAAERQRTLFHAVSSLGAPPQQDHRLAQAEPIRCSDPLGAALRGMIHRPMVTS